ncbi:PilW family protein [Thalassotalea euphylliae]|uniref:Prepilin-type N-terminal cleavage/methylation domain-containing protein n=1 Tax=Thalassotalea euphylliae TaxID=1655234 RepID=A0A3E0UD17_9GAMM|nr:prepilin-type N-terminal cleavage/methylation domain-containing protein [Thalassotalea euphylliae]REL34888.1 prepilin-type N-terminal cleavage/methylation domain-containing protein [Thalassotalea euphylliae]
MGKRLAQGFTLIELMVAMSLLSFIIFVGSLSYSTYISGWTKIKGKIDSNISQAKHLILLRQAVASTTSYIVKNAESDIAIFFKGKAVGFESMTSSPIFDYGYPAFYQIVYEQDESGNNRLVYKERSSRINHSSSDFGKHSYENSLNIISGISDFKVSYFGWSENKYKYQEFDSDKVRRQWFDEYDAMSSKIMPEAISMQFKDAKGESYTLFFGLLEGSDKLISRAQGNAIDV